MGIAGVVAAGSSPAAQVGVQVLKGGGNAVDAAVAATLAMGVADPANASIAGRCHVLVVRPDMTAATLDGRTALPRAFADSRGDTTTEGAGIVPVPGNPATLFEASRRWGRVAWEALCRPAARLAADGVTIGRCLGAAWAEAAPGLRGDRAAAALFLPDSGNAPGPGFVFRQERLARTLEDVALTGPDAIMVGPRMSRVLGHLQARGSLLSVDDFAAYQPLDGELVRCDYRGWQVITIGRQGYGHTLAETLGILARFNLASMGAADRWLHVSLAQRIAREDRPAQETDPAEHLLDPALHDRRAEGLRELMRAGPAAVLACFGPPPPPPTIRRGDTTHISAVDADGTACAITTSIGPHFGALVAAPEDGFLFAHSYRMAERDRSARRDRTEMLPTILCGPNGERIALGAAGSSRIPGAVLRSIVAMVDLGHSPMDALVAPPSVWHDGRLRTHPDIGVSVIELLREAGLPVDIVAAPVGQHYGLAHVAARDSAGGLAGAADPWWDGAAWTLSADGGMARSPA